MARSQAREQPDVAQPASVLENQGSSHALPRPKSVRGRGDGRSDDRSFTMYLAAPEAVLLAGVRRDKQVGPEKEHIAVGESASSNHCSKTQIFKGPLDCAVPSRPRSERCR